MTTADGLERTTGGRHPIAMFVWLPFLAADLGCMFGGTISIALQNRGVGLITARLAAFTVGAVLMTVDYSAFWSSTTYRFAQRIGLLVQNACAATLCARRASVRLMGFTILS
jgi:hypothetical protein